MKTMLVSITRCCKCHVTEPFKKHLNKCNCLQEFINMIFEMRHFCYMKKNLNCDKVGLFEGSFFFRKD